MPRQSIRNISVITDLPYKIPPIEDITEKLPRHPQKTWGWMKPEDIDTIIVHHMASEAPLENQAKYHVNKHDWPGIAYKLVVYHGRLYQTNDLLWFTYHAAGHNENTVSIAVHGDLSKRGITSLERELLYAGILTLKSIFPGIKHILGHNEVCRTSCPCTSMNKIRDDIEALEQRMKKDVDTWKEKIDKAGIVRNEIAYMLANVNKGETISDAQRSMQKLMTIYDYMDKNKMLPEPKPTAP